MVLLILKIRAFLDDKVNNVVNIDNYYGYNKEFMLAISQTALCLTLDKEMEIA